MADKVEISNVVFKIGNKTIILTLEEAKELQDLLNKELVHAGTFTTDDHCGDTL